MDKRAQAYFGTSPAVKFVWFRRFTRLSTSLLNLPRACVRMERSTMGGMNIKVTHKHTPTHKIKLKYK